MKLFEEVTGKQYTWKLFYLLNNIPCSDDRDVEEIIGDVKLCKKLSTGLGVDIGAEEVFLNSCRHLHVFTKEIELALLSGDKETYLYQAIREGEECVINSLSVVGNYIYITKEEICSPVILKSGEVYSDRYFINFKEYVLNNHTECDNFAMNYNRDNKEFLLSYNDNGKVDEVMKIVGADINISYPFVYYVLKKLSMSGITKSQGFEKEFKVTRIRRIEV